MTSLDDDFEALLQASSLGTEAARSLRERTSEHTASVIRRITQLRNDIAHGSHEAFTEHAAAEIFHALDGLTTDDTALGALRAAVLQARTQKIPQAAETLAHALEATNLLHWEDLPSARSRDLEAALRIAAARLAGRSETGRSDSSLLPSEHMPPRSPHQVRTPEQPSDRQPEDDESALLTVAEVATIMDVQKTTVYRLVHSGHLPAVRFGRSFRVPADAVQVYMREARVDSDHRKA